MAYTVEEFRNLDLKKSIFHKPLFPCITCKELIEFENRDCGDCYYDNLASLMEQSLMPIFKGR